MAESTESCKIFRDVLEIADNYKALFIDVYGVLFNGVSLYDQALVTLEKLKKDGKKIVILSNTTQISSEAKLAYAQKGMIQGIHYDEFVTSGEFLRYTIKNDPQKFTKLLGGKADSIKCIFMGNFDIFEGTHIKKKSIEEADFIYMGVPRSSYGAVRIDDVWDRSGNRIAIEDVVYLDWHELRDSRGRQGLAEFASQLKNCLKLNKPLLVANPDIFSHWASGTLGDSGVIITQGALGAYYEKLGGKVVYFGKPYSGIFKYAQEVADVREKILMIGDTPWTDISGANSCGLDSALVTETGTASEFLRKMESSLDSNEKLRALLEKIAPKMTKMKHSVSPTYFLKYFGKPIF
ncbi:MAG: HAD-IA family hydrolase [Holosporaceae bacterium]|jgi:HAD superfamily hydrolase (TIGR01450 family)|nr:HAD-IA family hydrolase [Holosporaceae bacterium]